MKTLLAAVTLLLALLAPAPPATAAPTVTVTPTVDAGYPQRVPASGTGQTASISVVVSSSEPVTNATVTAGSPGNEVVVTDPVQQAGTLAQPTTISFHVSGATPGFHYLFVMVHVSGAPPSGPPSGVFFSAIWTSGSPLPTTGGTAGYYAQAHADQEPGQPPRMVTFVSHQVALVGLPAHGEPACTSEAEGCVPYWVDASPRPEQVFQIGTTIVGARHRSGLYVDDLSSGPHDFIQPSHYVERRAGLKGSYRYADPTRTTGLVREQVTLHKPAGERVGDYRLTYRYAGTRKRTLEGTFEVDEGAVTFRSARGRVVQRGTLMVQGRIRPCAREGTCRYGGRRGILLVLSGRSGNHPDGNILQRVR